MITNAKPDWDSLNSDALRTFLESPTGQRLLPALAHDAPSLFDGSDVNKTLVRNGEFRGYQEALRNLLVCAYPPGTPTQQDPYPSLDDDSKWDDKEKLNPTT